MTDQDRDKIARFARIVRVAFDNLILVLSILDRMQGDEDFRNAMIAMHGSENVAIFQEIATNESIQAALTTIQSHPQWLAAVGYPPPTEED